MVKSPFKFLDSYTKDDRDIFFGRDREIEELYQKVFDSKLMLVYGVSGTGKSSLIHCGLANKFLETDWLPLVVRRGGNILENTAASILEASITPQKHNFTSPAQFRKGVQSLYLDYYKPIFFIFDQFEELFIFGDKEERKEFIQVVKTLIESDLQCRLIFVMREEYMAGITEFEAFIPSIFANRVRIEKMSKANALLTIEQPCRIFNINLEEGFSASLLERLTPEGSDVELTYLQVFLDKIFKLAQDEKPGAKGGLEFRLSLLESIGNVSDLLGTFLDDQVAIMENPEQALTVLKSFVSIKGTKRQMTAEEAADYTRSLGKPVGMEVLQSMLQKFVQLRILQDKDPNERYELRHDALAAKVFEKITLVEKELLEIRHLVENAFHSWQKRGVLLSANDLQYIAPYESRLFLPAEQAKLIEKSKYELEKVKIRRRRIFTAAAAVLIIILGGFTSWALKERKSAVENEKIALAERERATASEKEAIIARDIAIESDLKATAMEKEASAARDRAEASEIRIKREKELTERREIQTRAGNFNYLSKEVSADDPTIALGLAAYAKSLDPGNPSIQSNLNNIYYNNALYRVFYRFKSGNLCKISPDWTKIISTNGRSAKLEEINGDNAKILMGHLISGFSIIDIHEFSRRGSDDIVSICISPDGNHVLTGSIDGTAMLWDSDGNCLQVFRGHFAAVRSVSFSTDGKQMVTGGDDMTVRLWDREGVCLRIFRGHKGVLSSTAFSPDGNTILSGSADSTAILWDLKGNIVTQFKGHKDEISKVLFSHDGKTILTGSLDQTARLWDLEGNVRHVYTGHSGSVWAAAFSPDDETILTGSSDGTARLCDLYGNTIQILRGHKGSVFSVAYSPPGDRIITFSSDGISRIWDISGTVYRNFIGHANSVYQASFSPDGKTIMTIGEDQALKLWDLEGNSQQSFKLRLNSVAFSPDGNTILTGSITPQLIDLKGNVLTTFKGQFRISAVAFAPDGQTLVTGSADKTARLWTLDGNTKTIFKGHSEAVTCVAFSPDAKTIVTGSKDNTARLWDLDGNTIKVFSGHTGFINSVDFAPDGKTILTGSADKTARLWDLNGNTVKVFSGHSGFIYSVDFAPDGKSVITGSGDKTARLWDMNGNTTQIFDGYKSAVYSVSFSPDGRTVLTGSGDNVARLHSIKMPIEPFMNAKMAEDLSLENKLEYGIISIDRVKNEKELSNLFEGLEYCIAQAKLDEVNSKKYLDEAEILIRKMGNQFSGISYGERFISDAIELYRLRPRNYLLDKVDEINQVFGRLSSIDELKSVYDYYSEKCSKTDLTILAMQLPDYFISNAGKLLLADTMARKTISMDLAGLSWPLLQNSQFETALNAVELALEADSANICLYTTLPLVLLLNNRYDEAAALYSKYGDKTMLNFIFGTYKKTYLADIADLESRGITHPDFPRAKELLKN